jgi:DNA-binding response OmpR family regulator
MESHQRTSCISIVDDDESARVAIQGVLKSVGWQARSFCSAEEFLESGQLRETACLISDIRMPGMSGLELQTSLVEGGWRIPIIFVTAHGDARTRTRAMGAGAMVFLGKPFDDKLLLEGVRTALENRPSGTAPTPKGETRPSLVAVDSSPTANLLQGPRQSGVAPSHIEQELSGFLKQFSKTAARCKVSITGRPKQLKPSIQEQMNLIGREALVNALLHSKATCIEAEIEYLSHRVRLVVRDNGRGIDPQAARTRGDASRGLVGMRDRAQSIGAKLTIWSRPGAGTEVEISVPSSQANLS